MYASKRRLDSKHEQWRTDSFRASHRSTYLSKHGAIPTCNSSLHPPSSSPAVHPARCSKLKRISPRSLISQHQLHFIQHRAFFSFRSPPSGGGGGKIARILYGLGLLGGVILAKAKYVLVLLKLTKLMPLASMVLTSLTYSYIFGWQYGVGMVALVLVHECGHAVAMHKYNVPFSPMVFVPFIGAFIAMEANPVDAYEDGVIALAGPVFGTAAALSMAAIGHMTDMQIFFALADFGFLVNLFNLLPVGSMDGGRVGNAIHPAFGVVGVLAGAGLMYEGYIHNPIFMLFILGGAYSSVSRYMGWTEVPANYYDISRKQQLRLAFAYFMLIMLLCIAMTMNNTKRKSPTRLKREAKMKETGALPGGVGVYEDVYGNSAQHHDDDEWDFFGGSGKADARHEVVWNSDEDAGKKGRK